MNKITLLGNHISQPSRAIMWFLLLNNIPFDFKLIKLEKGEHRSETYKTINPMQQIPALTITSDKETVSLFESQAILMYLFHRYRKEYKIAGSWYPDPHSQLLNHTKVNMYLNYHNSTLRSGIAGYVFDAFVGPSAFMLPKKDEQTLKALEKKAHRVLKALDIYWLKDGPYLCGQAKITFADLLCYSELMQLLLLAPTMVNSLAESEIMKPYPNISKWLSIMHEIPHHAKVFEMLDILRSKAANRTSKL